MYALARFVAEASQTNNTKVVHLFHIGFDMHLIIFLQNGTCILASTSLFSNLCLFKDIKYKLMCMLIIIMMMCICMYCVCICYYYDYLVIIIIKLLLVQMLIIVIITLIITLNSSIRINNERG